MSNPITPNYGIMSILPSIEVSDFADFERVYNMVGLNTGNLLFTNAVWNQLAGNIKRFNYLFDPEQVNSEVDALVIPAANWLNPHVDFGYIADAVERLDIPVVLIGLGAQDVSYSGNVSIPEGTERFVRAVSERSASISVRGVYTAEILNTFGINNVTVTGCPSLYHNFREFDSEFDFTPDVSRSLVHSTRFSSTYLPFGKNESIHRALFRFAYKNKLDLLLQSEPEEMAVALGHPYEGFTTEALKDNLKVIYDADIWTTLGAYLREHGKLYFDVNKWSSEMASYSFALGTRLHGTIMALNSGLPAVLIHHDSRTQELCEFANIPSIPAGDIELSENAIHDLMSSANFRAYYDTRKKNYKIYKSFFSQNGLILSEEEI